MKFKVFTSATGTFIASKTDESGEYMDPNWHAISGIPTLQMAEFICDNLRLVYRCGMRDKAKQIRSALEV